jgi:starch-binding outer membrane protein, SusD/RagB family
MKTIKKYKLQLVGRIKTLLVLCGVGLLLNSCNDWLSLKPTDTIVTEDYWQSQSDVYSAVIGCYSSLLDYGLISKIIYWGELRGDVAAGGSGASAEVKNVIKGEISTSNTIIKWDEFYTTINQCNDVLAHAEGVRAIDASFTEATAKQYEAEALTIRALMYFYLVRSFGNVPLVLQASESDAIDYNVAKTDGTIILDTLVSNLKTAINYLPSAYGDNASNKGRITIWTAKTLLADIYLWKEDYENCVAQCSDLIDSGQFSLIPVSKSEVEVEPGTGVVDTVYHSTESDIDNLFDKLYVTGNSLESIFELQFPSTASNDVLADAFYALFNNSSKPVLQSNDNYVTEELFPAYDGDDDEVYDIRSTTFSYKNSYVWKWTGLGRSLETQRSSGTFPHWIIYRYADVLLMKAEALTQLAIANADDQETLLEAYLLVKEIRDRANAVESSETVSKDELTGKSLESLILSERGREFAFEGKRWYDVLRQAKRDNFSSSNYSYLQNVAIHSAPSDKLSSLLVKYKSKWFCYWPIYSTYLETNPNLVQNEYYAQ